MKREMIEKMNMCYCYAMAMSDMVDRLTEEERESLRESIGMVKEVVDRVYEKVRD